MSHVAALRQDKLHSPNSIEQQAALLHHQLKAVIISHTGHEQDAHTRSDKERYYAHRALAKELNDHLQLGMDKKDQQLLSLINTSLSYTNRFEGDPYIPPEKGESPVKHSAHAAADYMLACYRAKVGASAEEKLKIVEGTEFQYLLKQGALIQLWHDADEVFGEPTTVHSRAVSGGQEQDASQGIQALHYALVLAMRAIEEKERLQNHAPLDAFFDQCATIRALADIKQCGYANILHYMEEHPAPPISEDGKMRVAKALRHYAVAEQQLPLWHELTAQNDNVFKTPSPLDAFLSASTKARERNEGNSHYNRFFTEAGVTDMGQGKLDAPEHHISGLRARDGMILHAATTSMQRAESHLLSYHGVKLNRIGALKNLEYGESKMGDVLASANTSLQQAIAAQCVIGSYRTLMQILANGPVFLDRFPERESDFTERQQAAKHLPDDADFLQEQAELRSRYYRESSRKGATGPRRELPRIVTRQEMISVITQIVELVEQGRWREMLVPGQDGKMYYGTLTKRTEPLPKGIDLNQSIPLSATGR